MQVDFATMPPSIEYVRAGKLRALAVTTATRSQALSETPTVADFVPGFEAVRLWCRGAEEHSAEIIRRLNKEINEMLADPRTKARFADLGAEVLSLSPAYFGKLLAEETEKWAKVIKFAGIKAD